MCTHKYICKYTVATGGGNGEISLICHNGNIVLVL
jgi:hypothetical protein